MMTLVFGGHGSHARHMNGDSSLTLLLRAREGDAVALDHLVQRYLPALRRWTSDRLPAGVCDAEDTDLLAQDSLLQAVGHFERLEPLHNREWHSYLRVEILDRIRARCRDASGSDPAAQGGQSPFERAVGREAADRYDAALARLSDVDREAIVARIEFGLEYADLAAYLSQPSPDAARIAVNRALVRLASFMTS